MDINPQHRSVVFDPGPDKSWAKVLGEANWTLFPFSRLLDVAKGFRQPFSCDHSNYNLKINELDKSVYNPNRLLVFVMFKIPWYAVRCKNNILDCRLTLPGFKRQLRTHRSYRRNWPEAYSLWIHHTNHVIWMWVVILWCYMSAYTCYYTQLIRLDVCLHKLLDVWHFSVLQHSFYYCCDLWHISCTYTCRYWPWNHIITFFKNCTLNRNTHSTQKLAG